MVEGASYGGGIIAHILVNGDPGYNPTVTHGIIAAPYDQSIDMIWGCISTSLGNTSNILGFGQTNTNNIVAACGQNTAAYMCDSLTMNGYSDWFLPSMGELIWLLTNKDLIGSFYNGGFYWSSNEASTTASWALHFGGFLGWGQLDRSSLSFVRAIRKF